MQLYDMIDMQLMLFFLLGIGFVAAKLRLIDKTFRVYLTELIVSLVLPCNIVASFMVDFEPSMLLSLGFTLAVGFGIQLFCLLLSKVFYRRQPQGRRMVLRYATMCSNASFIGNPVVEGLYGAPGLLYASIYLIPLRIFMWTAGLSCFTTTTRRAAVKKLLRHPCIIAAEIGILLLVTGLRPPAFVSGAIGAVGSCTTALSMLVIGSILAEIPLKTVFSRTAFFFSFVRLLLIPACVLAVLLVVSPQRIVTEVSVVLAGMPAGATTAILATKYGGDAEFSSKIIFVSTLLSMVTVPLLAAALSVLV